MRVRVRVRVVSPHPRNKQPRDYRTILPRNLSAPQHAVLAAVRERVGVAVAVAVSDEVAEGVAGASPGWEGWAEGVLWEGWLIGALLYAKQPNLLPGSSHLTDCLVLRAA